MIGNKLKKAGMACLGCLFMVLIIAIIVLGAYELLKIIFTKVTSL